jgi:hypothetical protein
VTPNQPIGATCSTRSIALPGWHDQCFAFGLRTPKERPTMNKLLTSVGLAIAVATASLLTGCQLYFDDHNDRHSSSPDPNGGSSGPGAQPGFSCTTDANCAAGCFCADGTCTEAGFCSTDKDCGDGFICDVARSSCEPGQAPPAVTCAGTASATCTATAPACPAGQTPLLQDGCFTGVCGDIATCDAPPTCEALQHQSDCSARTADCTQVFVGRNCKGTTCGVSAEDCTCESYTYAACDAMSASTQNLLIEN